MSTEKNYLESFNPEKVRILSHEFPLIQHFLFEIRDVGVQKDREKFRRNLERIGTMMAWQLSSFLEYEAVEAQTPLGTKLCMRLSSQLVLGTVLRAGIPFWNGFLEVFPNAEVCFAGAYRAKETEGELPKIDMHYLVNPPLDDKTLILIDPMLATGQSLVTVLNHLTKNERPKKIFVCALIATHQGISFVQSKFPHASFWLADIDDGLDSRHYIVPGLGDAGDLSFGEK